MAFFNSIFQTTDSCLAYRSDTRKNRPHSPVTFWSSVMKKTLSSFFPKRPSLCRLKLPQIHGKYFRYFFGIIQEVGASKPHALWMVAAEVATYPTFSGWKDPQRLRSHSDLYIYIHLNSDRVTFVRRSYHSIFSLHPYEEYFLKFFSIFYSGLCQVSCQICCPSLVLCLVLQQRL